MKGGEAEFFLENEKIAPRQAMQRGSGLIPPIQGRSRRARETIEATLGEIHVHDQFDQSSRNFGTGIFFRRNCFMGIPGKGNQTFHLFSGTGVGKSPDFGKNCPNKSNLSGISVEGASHFSEESWRRMI